MRFLYVLAQSKLSEAVGWTLAHFLWEGVVIAAMLAPLLVFVRSPRTRYVAANMALLVMALCFAITLIRLLPEHDMGARTLLQPTFVLPSPNAAGNGTEINSTKFDSLISLLAPLWFCGVCVFYLRYAVGWLSLLRMRVRGTWEAPSLWQRNIARLAMELKISRPVMLVESLFADAPAVLGHLRPVILLPAGFFTGLPPDHVEAILLHELAHIRRSDYLMNIFKRLVIGLLFYHPATWWISRIIEAERENCCDDMVVNLRGDAHAYAAALTAIEQNRLEKRLSYESVMAVTGGSLMKRIRRLLYPSRPSGIWAPVLAALLLVASTAISVAAWRVNPSPGSAQTDAKDDNPWQRWLNEEVVYIISANEKSAFQALKTDEERQQFVDQFWARRDPTPDTPENEFQEEHYRRIAFANQHWGKVSMPGWKTDRGRIYILHGPPDEIDSHPSGGSYKRPDSEGGGYAMTYPFEDWRYRVFEGVGNLTVEFVDKTSSGDFRMTLDPKEKYQKP